MLVPDNQATVLPAALTKYLRSRLCFLLLVFTPAVASLAQSWDSIPTANATENAPLSRKESDLPRGPAPRTPQGHPDFSGYWIPSSAPEDKPVGNLGKDLPGYRLPFTAAGEAAHRYNVAHTIDPAALCVPAGIPRQNTNGLPFQIVEGSDNLVFLYWTTTYRLIPFNKTKHSADPDPSFFGDATGSWSGDEFVIDSIAFKSERTWADENADPHSDRQHVIERWTRPDVGHLHLEMTVIDPKLYLHSIHYRRTWLFGNQTNQVPEYSCTEDNVDATHLMPGPGPIGPDGQRGSQMLAPLPPPPDKDHPAVTSIPE
jgi:hypothetical protein